MKQCSRLPCGNSTAVVRAGQPAHGSVSICLITVGDGGGGSPTQILEMAWATALFGAAILLRDRKLPAGAIFCLAVVTYGTGGM